MKSNVITVLFLLLLLALLTKFSTTLYDIRAIGMLVFGFVMLAFFILLFK
jgi:hypothetical protein